MRLSFWGRAVGLSSANQFADAGWEGLGAHVCVCVWGGGRTLRRNGRGRVLVLRLRGCG